MSRKTESAPFTIRMIVDDDREWLHDAFVEVWGSAKMVSRGKLYECDTLPGLLAEVDGERAGFLVYHVEQDEIEIVGFGSLRQGLGIGSALIEEMRRAALAIGAKRLWLITTNDNTPALRFYQKRGFILAALHPNALEASRKLKPEIPLRGLDGIPLRDEIELELPLNTNSADKDAK